MASRKDVAAAAGVSVRTVSNVVNEYEHVAPETRRRVLEAIDRLAYRPSELARSLKVGRSGLIGLMLPYLDVPYFAEITQEFVRRGTEHGMTVVIDQTDGDRARELSWIHRTASGALFDALILSPLGLRPSDVDALPLDRPVVFLGEVHFPGVDQVMVDSIAASRDAVLHLAAMGRSRIAAIGKELPQHGTSAQRLEGYRRGLHAAGHPVRDELIFRVDSFTRAQGYQAALRMADQENPPDAVYCFTDTLALGALRALHERGVRVPEDIAVVGFDDIDDGRFSIPTLTTVQPDKQALAAAVFDRLLMRLRGDRPDPEVIIAPHVLVRRESSGSSPA